MLAARSSSSFAAPPTHRGGLVLVVDDSDWVRDVLAAWLRREGFSVQLAADGPAAVEQYQRAGARFAVALVDKHMPGWDGLHSIAHLKRLDPGLPCPKRTPAAFGLPFEDVRFETADHVRLAAWLVPHPQARGTVIFCHGHGRNRGHVAGVLQTLHELRLNVLAFDFRGHGDSGGHTSTFGHREVQDLKAAVAFMSSRCPGQPLVLVGVSLGAAVSLQALRELPDVKGLWSEGAFARFGHCVDRKFAWLLGVLCRPLVGGYYLLGCLDSGMWGPSVNPVDCLQGVTVPIFFCHAQDDELVPFSDGQALYATYRGSKDHWWVAGASHYNVRQRNRDEYLSRLWAFLEECLSRG